MRRGGGDPAGKGLLQYPGAVSYTHLKETTLKEMMAKKPEKVVELAVKGMLPKGPLGRSMMTKLHVYAGADHEQAAQKPEVLEIKF